ncbi:MAG: saccharopine dehydrogenase NADP-binding domain-containing protein, partial [Pseudomonadota bacterium]
MSKPFDVIVYGASGFTGRLVAEYLSQQYGLGGDIRWAMAGRSLNKLASVRSEIGASEDTPLVQADASDPASLAAMVTQTHCVLTTVGPYQLYGSDLVAACAKAGTDYVDLCGEPAWMHQMISAHEETAKASGARIVFSCGFDSIPFDLGVFYLQQQAQAHVGKTLPKVRGRVKAMKGGFSGGTAASLKATLAAAADDPNVLQVLRNPFALAGGFEGPKQPSGNKPLFEEDLGSWSAPFIMAAINTRNIHRSNALMDHHYGADFTYDEMMLTGPGDSGEEMANVLATTKQIGTDNDPKPGEGPSKEEREQGLYEVLFIGEDDGGARLTARVTGDKDPGYGSTSKMIAESAICLVKDCAGLEGGIYTPAPAMGDALIKRLEANAGLTFSLLP